MSAHFHRLQRSMSPFAPAILPNRVTSSSTASSSQTAVNHFDRLRTTSGMAISPLELTALALAIIGLVGWLGFLGFQYSVKKAEEGREARGSIAFPVFGIRWKKRVGGGFKGDLVLPNDKKRRHHRDIEAIGREGDRYHLDHTVCYPQLVCIISQHRIQFLSPSWQLQVLATGSLSTDDGDLTM
jgi:hypothetical protein